MNLDQQNRIPFLPTVLLWKSHIKAAFHLHNVVLINMDGEPPNTIANLKRLRDRTIRVISNIIRTYMSSL